MTLNGGSNNTDRQETESFTKTFFRAPGAVEILIISALVHFSIGAVFGLIPEVLSDRYARVYHEYEGPPCSSFEFSDKPESCIKGSDEAQGAAATWNVATKLLSFVLNPFMGSISDVRGRRTVMNLGLLLHCIPPAVLLIAVQVDMVHPVWYYVSTSCVGVVDITGLSFAALSDVIPPEFRTAAFGMVTAAMYGGFSLGPSLAIMMSSIHLVVASFLLIFVGLLVGLFVLPETLQVPTGERDIGSPTRPSRENALINDGSTITLHKFYTSLTRPIRDISILNQSLSLQLITVGSFLSAMVLQGDVTLLMYYMEENLNVRRNDIASASPIYGLAGVVIQGVLLQPLVRWLGDRRLVIITFVSGTLHNYLYGTAKSKSTLLIALLLTQFTKVNIAILSSLATGAEQGRIQGAISGIKALAGALGPILMQAIYSQTENTPLGPGFMFIFASGLYLIGTVVVSFIPANVEEYAAINDLLLVLDESEIETPSPTIQAVPTARPDSNDGVIS